MRIPGASICAVALAASLAAQPAFAQDRPDAATFWKGVQATCNATAVKPAGDLGRRIAQAAIDEFARFGGHRIDSTGRLFRFGLTEAEHVKEEGDVRPAGLGHLGWWRVMAYWRALFGDEAAQKLDVRGYRDASTSTDDKQTAALVRATAADLLRAVDGVSDPVTRELLRAAVLRAAIVDTPWSAAFISYVVKQAGVTAKAFTFANAHQAFIYDAFATDAAELSKTAGDRIYRACSLATTIPRAGDLICFQREAALADASEEAVRERIRAELDQGPDKRTVRRTHCDVVAFVDAPARKMYVIGGNDEQAVAVKKLNLRSDLRFSAPQKGDCDAPGHWALPQPSAGVPGAPKANTECSLNDRKWFVLLQLR